MKLYYVVSHPKSGATWFRFLMYSLFFQKLENSGEVQKFYPEVPSSNDKIQKNIKENKTFFIKSHFDYSKDLPYVHDATSIILITRNPFDCMLSKFDHFKYEGVNWVYDANGFKIFCDKFIEEADYPAAKIREKVHGGWNYHTKLWMQTDIGIPIIHIRYEDMIDDTALVLTKLCKTLNFNFSEKEITTAVNLSSFQNLKKIEEYELENSIPGMFYNEKRRESYKSDKSLMFIKVGKKRNAVNDLDPQMVLDGKIAFYEGMNLAGYR